MVNNPLVPYLASLEWYRGCMSRHPAIPAKGRWNRTVIAPGEMLSIPVQGGIKVVKYGDPSLWMADDTRGWRHQHLGAINAHCSRTPFYRHYAPEILDIIGDTGRQCVADISAAIDAVVRRGLDMERFLKAYNDADADTQKRIADYARHICHDPDEKISMASYIFRYGPDAIFLLVETLL